MVPEPVRKPRAVGSLPEIEGYVIEKIIGRGSAGVVYRARQTAVDRVVALKVLHPELTRRPKIVQRLQREARTSARLAHPHVVSAIDMGKSGDLWWYAMEYVDGQSLALLLRQDGRLPERAALGLFIPLCRALEHLWEHGVVHRDIKPANILIDLSGGARLADMGLAFSLDDPAITVQGATLGTPHYISPEQAVDPASADIQSDIWSFGATLFHALAGRPPFKGESAAEVLSGVMHQALPDPRRLDPELSKGIALVIRKCLARDLDVRYRSPRELRRDLERIRERRAPLIRERSLAPTRGRPRRLITVAAAIGGALAALVVARVVNSLTEDSTPRDPFERNELVGEPAPREPYEPLEALVSRWNRRPERVASLLSELSALEIPPAYGARRDEFRIEARIQLEDRLAAARSEVDVAVSEAVQRGDLEGAATWLEGRLDQMLLERVGMGAQALDAAGLGTLGPWLSRSRAEFELTRRTLLADVAQAVQAERERILDSAAKSLGEGQWHVARRILTTDSRALLQSLGYGEWKIASRDLAPIMDAEQFLLGQRLRDLDNAWRALDRSLRSRLRTLALDLEQRLLDRVLRRGAAAALRGGFTELQADAGILAPPADLPFAARNELEAQALRLDGLERELLEAGAAGKLQELEKTTVRLWPARDYVQIQELLQKFETYLVQEGAGSAWGSDLLVKTRTRLREASDLEALIGRAWEGVLGADGSIRDVSDGGIKSTGRIEVEPVAEVGRFRLLGVDGLVLEFDVRMLSRAELLEFAGITEGDPALSESDRRLLGILAERDATGTMSMAPSGEEEGLKAADRDGTGAQESTETTLRRIYGLDEEGQLSRPNFGRVRLSFHFPGALAGAWEARSWEPDGSGWVYQGAVSDLGALLVQRGPRLVLRGPLLLDARGVVADLVVQRLASSGPHQVLVVSLAGFHLALLGPGLPGGDGQDRWLATTAPLQSLFEDIREGKGRVVPSLLVPGKVHRIRLDANPRTGRLTIDLDEKRLGTIRGDSPDFMAPAISIRSWGEVRIISAEIAAGI